MTTKLHFGYKPNKHVCSCGRHYGYGDMTAEQRAERAKSMRKNLSSMMPDEMRAFLRDWEMYHSGKPANYRSAYAD